MSDLCIITIVVLLQSTVKRCQIKSRAPTLICHWQPSNYMTAVLLRWSILIFFFIFFFYSYSYQTFIFACMQSGNRVKIKISALLIFFLLILPHYCHSQFNSFFFCTYPCITLSWPRESLCDIRCHAQSSDIVSFCIFFFSFLFCSSSFWSVCCLLT